MAASLVALVRVVVALGVIIALMMFLARVAQKRQGVLGKRVKSDGQIEVLSRRSLGQHVSLVVVRVGRRTLLVGQASQQMSLLAELEDEAVEPSLELAVNVASLREHDNGVDQLFAPGTARGSGELSPGAWDAFIERLRELTVRR